MRIKPVFAWYDFWVGIYYDRNYALYVFPIPMVGFKIEWAVKCERCGKRLYPNEISKYCGYPHCYKCKQFEETFDEDYA